MNIMILGSSGFIGSWITTELLKAGYTVTCCVRNVDYAKRIFPQAKIIACDFLKDADIAVWKKRLANIDVLINCIGIFYHPKKEVIWKIHYYTPRVIFDACFEMHVEKIIQISALNVDRYNVEYAKSKKAAEDHLNSLGVPATILRPSLVYGPKAHGGMLLLRTLASLPFFIPVPGKGKQQFQPIHVADLSKAVIHLLKETDKRNKVLAAVSLEPITIKKSLLILRNWLGLSKARIVNVPLLFIRIINFFNDYLPSSKINSDAIYMLSKNNIVDQSEALHFQHVVKFTPRNFAAGVYSQPSGMEDRWYTKILLLKPLLRLSLVFMWFVSAITSAFIYPHAKSLGLLQEVGVPHAWQTTVLYSACILNFLIAMTLLINYRPKLNYILQICIIVFYTLIISIKLPYFWAEPFGSIAKNIPILSLILLLLFIERKH